MARPPLTEAEVRIILAGPLVVHGPIIWRQKGNDTWTEAQLVVEHHRLGVKLSLRINTSLLSPSKYTCTLLLNEEHRILSLDVGSSHRNKHTDQQRWINQAHEHRWTDTCQDTWAGAAAEPRDLESGFQLFCQRAGINFAGQWVPPPAPVQLGFENP